MGGIYTVTVTLLSCTSTATTTIGINAVLVPGLGVNTPICVGNSLNLTCTNGVSWSWTGPNGFTSALQNPTITLTTIAASGTYSVSVTDASGCTGSATVAVVVNPLPVVAVNSTAICLGQSIANLTASGASSYTWTSGTSPSIGASVIATPSATTTYTVTGTDLNGCVNTAISTVTVNSLPVSTASNTGPYCVGGTIQLSATGGTIYSWSGPNGYTAFGSNPTILPAVVVDSGNYDVVVTDANGCTTNGLTNVVVNTALTPILSSNSPICEQQGLSLTSSNGLTWSWTGPNGFVDFTQSPLINLVTIQASGIYSVSVVDGNGCVGTGTISVAVNPLPIVTVNSTAICLGQTIANLTALGANNYTWSLGTSPSNSANVTASPGNTSTFTVTGTDLNGCQDTSVAMVTVNSLPNVFVNSPAICPGLPANLTATGAFTYSWTSGTIPAFGSVVVVNPISTSQYTVTGTDVNGCESVYVSTVTVNAQLVIDAGLEDTVCVGDNVILNATGSFGTTYTWNPGALIGAAQNFSATATTTFTVSGIDGNGCLGLDSVLINVPANIVLNAGGFSTTCNGVCDGQIVVLASPISGSFAQYSYLWQNGGSTLPSVNGICAGTYTVTVTNNAGCFATATATVTEPIAVLANASNVTSTTCNSVCDGSVTITANGGTPPYTYNWSSLGSGSAPNNLCAGSYTCAVTDMQNCSTPVTVVISEPPVMTVLINPTAAICIGQASILTAVASGGNGGYNYTWTGGTNPTNTSIVSTSPVSTSIYTVSVIDVNNCAPVVASITVTVNAPLNVVASSNVTLCAGQAANMSATASGGNGVYQYNWATGTTPTTGSNVSAIPMGTTTYTVTVTDACGTPPSMDSVVVTVNSLPTLSITSSAIAGCAPLCSNFTINSNPAMSAATWSFTNGTVANGSPVNNICFSTVGTYGATITVIDINGCQNSFTNSTIVVVYPNPIAAFSYSPIPASEINPVIKFTDSSYGAAINGWMWHFGNLGDSSSVFQNPTFDYGVAGSYEVWLSVSTINGCVDSVVHTVVIDPEFIIYVPNAFSPNEDGTNEFFFPKGVGVDEKNYQMWVYDRWGNMIFTTDDWAKGWNGKVQGHDEVVQEDVYVWKIRLKTFDGQSKSFVGHVTVVK